MNYYKKGRLCAVKSCMKLMLVACLSSLAASVWLSWSHTYRTTGSSSSAKRRLLVDTPACSIPDIDPYDDSVRRFIVTSLPITCSATPPMTYTDGEVLRFNHTAIRLYYTDELDYCEYQAIYKTNASSDNLYEYSRNLQTFAEDIAISTEFIRVACYGKAGDMMYANFHAFIIEKEEVEIHCEDAFYAFTKQHKPTEQLSVILLGVDSVSRLNFIRHMRRTRSFLLERMRAVELRGFNKLADNTYVNLVPMLAGKFIDELPWQENSSLPFDRYSFIWKNFSAAGYRTLFAEDAPKIAIFNYAKEGFYERPTDYYLRPFSLALEDHGSMWHHDHDCVGDRLETQKVLDWLRDFAYTFSDRPYFAKAFITRLTHDNINKAGLADRPYVEFLQQLQSDGSLDHTLLIFYSDHGMRFGPLRQTYVGKLEERLPFMYVALPIWFADRYPALWKNLQTNSKRLTTPFDVYETLLNFLPFTGIVSPNTIDKRGMSLLAEIPPERTCKQAGISPHWCACNRNRASITEDVYIGPAASHVVDFINSQLRRYRGRCAQIRLAVTTDAMKTTDDVGVTYLLVLRTQPGDALFEVTVRHTSSDGRDSYDIVGDISRINRYGDQAKCIKYHTHKKFCFCQ